VSHVSELLTGRKFTGISFFCMSQIARCFFESDLVVV
jgi:hypothetical protein